MTSYLILDFETTTHESFKRKANPFDPKNYPVMVGWWSSVSRKYRTEKLSSSVSPLLENLIYGHDLIVGHNLKFDLLYLRKYIEQSLGSAEPTSIFCTQLAEYLLSGQEHLYPSLDQCAQKYGGTLKDDAIAAYWAAGIDTPDIPEEQLKEYLLADIKNTHRVFLSQLKIAREKKMIPLLQTQMKALHATTEMEYNGIKIHVPLAQSMQRQKTREKEESLAKLKELVPTEGFDFNSNDHVGAYLYGLPLTFEKRVEVGVFKSGKKIGQPRFKIERTEVIFRAQVPLADGYKTEKGKPRVDEWVLKNISTRANVKEFAAALLTYRAVAKELSTYITSLINLADPSGIIHHSLNHVSTQTGRLSGTNPNMQNITNSEIKQVFVSRYPKGVLVEVDYSSLEVWTLAYLTQDRQLLHDLRTGVDMHRVNAAGLFGIPEAQVDDAQRKLAKVLSFQLQYGSGAPNMAKTLGISLSLAKKFVETYFERYPGIRLWHQKLEGAVRANAGAAGEDGRRKSFLNSCTGRQYVFKQYEAPEFMREKGTMWSFSPTQIKNYPNQGFATGDIVPMKLGELYDFCKNHRGKFLLINTIHDSVMFDCQSKHVDLLVKETKIILESCKESMKQYFNIDLNIDLSVQFKVGKSWFEMEEYK